MRLKALMIKLIPDDEIILKTRKFASKNAVFLDLEKYSKELRLGIENGDKCFITKSHFNLDKDFYYIPAFQIIDLEDEVSSKNYVIKYSPQKENFERALHYDEVYDVFYDLPAVKIKGGKWKYSNDIEEASGGSINAGVFYFNIYDRDTNVKINSKPYKMCVLPSSMSIEQYEVMINDLLNIKHELIIEDKKGAKQSIQVKWTNTLEEIEGVVSAIRKPLVEIDKNPKVRVWKEISKVSPKKIRKFNSRVLMELTINPGKSKYNAFIEIEDTDIYENQMLLYAIQTLKDYVKNFNDYVSNKLLLKRQKIKMEIQKMLDFYNIDSFKYLRNVVESNDKSRFYDLMMNKDDNNEENEGIIEVVVPIVRYSDDIKFNMYFVGGKLHSKIEGKWISQGQYSLDYERLCYTIIKKGVNEDITIDGRKASFELETSDVRQHLLLYYSIFNYSYDQIEIHARVKICGYNSYDMLMGKQVYNRNGEPYHNTYEYNIKAVDIISINGITTNSIIKNEQELKSLFNTNKGFIMNREQILEQMNMLSKKQTSVEQEILEIDSRNDQIERLSSELEELRNLNFFKKVSKRKNSWNLTQIFANDKNYSKLYKLLRNLDKRLEFSDSFNSKDIINKKADKLYEYWLLVKMLYMLIRDQQWRLEDGESIPNLISKFLKDKNNSNLENITFRLTHNGINSFKDIEMILFYNNVFPNNKTPDFAFKLVVKDSIKWFYLDAKYRDYKSMGQHFWYYDINEVAIKKYINSFRNTKTKAAASFIAHTDNRDKCVYFGGFFNKDLAKSLTNWQEDNPQHKFGSFYFLPDRTEHFITFTKLMLEYHFMEEKLWKVCWDCGSTDTLVEIKSTEGGNEKFHITCKNCHSFWVRNHCEAEGHKLVKHAVNNYHKETSAGDPWYVKCPQCDYVKYNGGIEIIDLTSDEI